MEFINNSKPNFTELIFAFENTINEIVNKIKIIDIIFVFIKKIKDLKNLIVI